MCEIFHMPHSNMGKQNKQKYAVHCPISHFGSTTTDHNPHQHCCVYALLLCSQV